MMQESMTAYYILVGILATVSGLSFWANFEKSEDKKEK